MHPLVGWSSPLVPLLLAAVALWAWIDQGPDLPAPRDGLAFVRHFIHYGLFESRASGSPRGPRLPRVSCEGLEPGDVLVCGNPGAVYGAWSHATIYLGDGKVLAQDLLSGIWVEGLAHLGAYDHVRILRPRLPASTRLAAATAAAGYAGRVFNLIAHPRDPWQLSCSRCVEAAYRAQGADITDGRFWITPDALADTAGDRLSDR